MVVIDFWIQKHLLPVIGENSLEKSNSIKPACWFSIESNGITQSGENLLQSMAMLNSKTLFGGEWDRWYFETLWQRIYQVICSNPCGVKIFVLNPRRLVDLVMRIKIKQLIDGERDNCCCWKLILKLFVAKKGEWKNILLLFNKNWCLSKKCCWHCVIGSKAKCNDPLTWCGLWCGLSVGLWFDLWSSPCIWRGWHNLTQATYFPREIPFQSVSMKRWFLVN